MGSRVPDCFIMSPSGGISNAATPAATNGGPRPSSPSLRAEDALFRAYPKAGTGILFFRCLSRFWDGLLIRLFGESSLSAWFAWADDAAEERLEALGEGGVAWRPAGAGMVAQMAQWLFVQGQSAARRPGGCGKA
jgi:hypothetical protein